MVMPHPETLTCFSTGVSVILSRLPNNSTQASNHVVVWCTSQSVFYDLYFTVFLSAFFGWYTEGRINLYSRKPCWPIFNILPWTDKIIWKILRACTHSVRTCGKSCYWPRYPERWHIPVLGKTLIVLNILNISAPKNIFHFCLTLLFYVTNHSHCLQRNSHPLSPKIKSNNSFVLFYFSVTIKMT